MKIGLSDLPQGTFELTPLLAFAGYSYITSMPVLSFMLLVASRFDNIWIPLGIGVTGFLSGMALANMNSKLLLINPFVVMLKPAVAMSAYPDPIVISVSLVETVLCLGAGLWMSKNLHYE
jgi:hypothetical protein